MRLFGYLFGGGVMVPGGEGCREFLMPGMFAMIVAFCPEATMTTITIDAAEAVTDRFRAASVVDR